MSVPPIKGLVKLEGKVQHYTWGGYDFLPQLLNIPNPDHKPFAEYWLGTHANAPALVHFGDVSNIPLDEYLDQYASNLDEEKAQEVRRKLPYLLKVLDVRDMLSIQVHPCKEDAYIGFQQENQAGIPLDAPHRNYKDDNHKPELMVALSDFWLLHGFRSPEKLVEMINAVPEFAFMLPLFREGSYRKLYTTIMQMEQEEVNRILQPLLERIQAGYEKDYFTKDDPHFWAARAASTFNQPGKIDRGIFSIYLLNLVHLKNGEAIFQDAGVLHAYLEGQNIEIMASSDNVLRGGLTNKHINTAELLRHVTFQATIPELVHTQKRAGERECIYETPVTDFQLRRYSLKPGQPIPPLSIHHVSILFMLEGEAALATLPKLKPDKFKSKISLSLVGQPFKKGEAYALLPGATIIIGGVAPRTVIYAATLPGYKPQRESYSWDMFDDD